MRVNTYAVPMRVSEAKRSTYFYAVAQWRLARACADLVLVEPVRVRVQGHLSHLGGGNGPPGAPTAGNNPEAGISN